MIFTNFQKIPNAKLSVMEMCYFCKRAPSESTCDTCKRVVCIQCSGSGNHNCYPRG